MPEVQIRKRVLLVEEIFHEGGPVASKPQRRAAALVVIRNPYAGSYVEKIESFMDDLKPLGLEMARALVAALGGDPKMVEGYGKGAIVGSAGELEHGALWHVPGGYAMREVWLRPRKWVAPGHGSTFRSLILMLPTCAAILMRWR
jgi:Amino acid synthesis